MYMRRVLSLFLLMIMLMSLVGCNSSEPKDSIVKENASGFRVGFGKVDVTPYDPVQLGSFGNEAARVSQGYIEPLYALSVVITDKEDNTLVLIVTDLSWGYYVQSAQVREAILKEYGISGEYVMLGGTHNHSGPAYYYKSPEVDAYMSYWMTNVMKSVKIAMDDRKPAEMQIGRTETEDLAFVRRYWLEDGTLLTDKDSTSKKIISHESEADEEVQMLRFVRKGAKDIYITNWQAHNSLTGNTLNATSDWVGVLREEVETALDCHCMYFQGAAGNQNPVSRMEGELTSSTPQEHGKAVAEYIINACRTDDTFTTVKSGPIKVKQMIYDGELREGVSEAAKERPAELNAISIGDVAIVTFFQEMFSTSGMQIKSQSPYEMTLLMGYTNGIRGYIPDEQGFKNGGYEAGNGKFAPGAAEEIVSIYLETLKELHE